MLLDQNAEIKNVEQALNDLYANKPQLLWTNSSSTSNFEETTINIDLSQYEKIYIKVAEQHENINNIFYIPIDVGTQKEFLLGITTTDANSACTATRTVTTTNTSITISNATLKQGTHKYSNYNYMFIPLCIYATKN